MFKKIVFTLIGLGLGIPLIVLGILIRVKAGEHDDLLLKVDKNATTSLEKKMGLAMIIIGSCFVLTGGAIDLIRYLREKQYMNQG